MNSESLLHRQVHPQFVLAGRVTSQAFPPTPKDQSLLSVYDGELITAEDAWVHFTETLKCPSAGVMAVSTAECNELQLTVRPDPEPFPEHAVIDFSGLSKSDVERKAKFLKSRQRPGTGFFE